MVQGLGFRDLAGRAQFKPVEKGLGFRVQGLGFRVQPDGPKKCSPDPTTHPNPTPILACTARVLRV